MTQAQGAFGRLTLATEQTYKATPHLSLHTCEAAWDEKVDADVVATADAAVFKVGTKSCKLAVADGVSADDILATDDITSSNLSAYTHIGMWIYSSVALSSGDLVFLLDETAQCASPLETLNIPAVAKDTWTYVKMALSTPASDTAIISIGVKMHVDKGACNIYIDDVRALTQAIVCPFTSESVKSSQNLNSSAMIRSTRNPTAPTKGNKDASGDISLELHPYIQRLLYYVFGAVSTASGTCETHTFTIGDTLPSFMYEKGFQDIGTYLQYNGCKVNSFKVTVPQEGAITASVSLVGSKETIATVPFDDDPVDDTVLSFDSFKCAITEGGSAIATVTTIDFEVNNNLDTSFFVIDSSNPGERYSLPAGKVKVSGNLTAIFENTTLYAKALAGTESAITIEFSNGTGAGTAGNEKLTFSFEELLYGPNSPVISGDKGVVVTMPFEAYYANGASASACKAVLLNTQSLT